MISLTKLMATVRLLLKGETGIADLPLSFSANADVATQYSIV